MKFYETRAFFELQAAWYKKLYATDFKDQEAFHFKRFGNKDNIYLNKQSTAILDSYTPEQADYYSNCRYFLENGVFESEIDRQIWALHANGVPYRTILKQLPIKRSIFFIYKRIQRVRTLMRILIDKELEADEACEISNSDAGC